MLTACLHARHLAVITVGRSTLPVSRHARRGRGQHLKVGCARTMLRPRVR
jgi:hypothetical protein